MIEVTSDDDKLNRELGRAQQAQRLLDNPLLSEALTALKRDFLDFWVKTKARETEERERIWQAYQIAGKFEAILRSMIADGQLADAQLKQMAKLGEKAKPANRVVLQFAHDA